MEKHSAAERKKLIISLMEEPSYVPMKEKELACIMQVEPEDRAELKRLLTQLLEEGRIQINKRGRYSIPASPLLVGTFTRHQKGFGFVEVEGRGEELYVSETRTGGAWHQDRVEVRLLPGGRGQRPEAEVVRVLARGVSEVVGTYQKSRSFGFVVPDSSRIPSDIFVPQERSGEAEDGSKVVVELIDYGGSGKSPEGRVKEILGMTGAPGVDVLSIIRGLGIPDQFPEKVENQARRCPQEVSQADRAGREDLRSLLMVTIDGEDARDLDDAVSLYMEDGKYHLGVHIADVSNYVQENSALDWEALNRGTSVYLTDRVIPMLPTPLSNGICSLNAGEDRLALSCLMTVDGKGEVVDYSIVESVIRVDRRMTYSSVAAVLEGEEEECARQREFVPMLAQMAQLSALIRAKRHQRGAVDFDFPESRILLDGQGHPVEILPRERNQATKLIEDFMLLANETVAQHFYWMQLPFLYRTHDAPEPDRIRELGLFVHNFGYSIKLGREEVHPKELQKLLERAEGTPEEALISRLTLRSMKQARYSPVCSGHFGLASRFYCHFTSPIRRYPDLQIHRIIKEQLRGRLSEQRQAHYEELLPRAARQSSQTERRAEEAERETEKRKKAEYMENHVGQVYEGVVCGVTGWGLYVELPNTVEGLVHVSALPGDFFTYEESACELRGVRTGISYKLGQRLSVKVRAADRLAGTIDFVLPWDEGGMEDGEGSEEADCE